MSVIDERIERGVAIFRRAGDDSALLGGALLAFHGAIERFLDGELANRPELGANERRLLTDGRLGWLTRANLAESHGLLTPEQRARALGATRACKPIVRGDPCPWTAAEVQSYGQLAAELCGRMELIGRIDQRAERARTTAVRAAPPAWAVPQERRRLSPARIAITAVFLATLAAVAWTIYQQLDGPRMLRALGALPAPTAEPLPFTPEPSPTPAGAGSWARPEGTRAGCRRTT